MESEIELLPNVLSLAKQTYCAMKRFDPYRGVYNFRTGNYHYTKLSDALNLIGKDFYGNDVSDSEKPNIGAHNRN